ncbi:MAG: class I poly(R)-hydroxyalkanoic acid synthase [Actinomycetota bacterium]|nr:class I poly(R)-hydroxyalkanoic acid synthase [Actinomycetota bacterium]
MSAQTSLATEATVAAQRAADALAPEAGILGDVDPALIGNSILRSIRGAAENPVGVLDATSRYAMGLVSAGIAALLRTIGRDAPGPMSPDEGDSRFQDPAWQSNPFFFWRMQRYLVASRLLNDLVDAANLKHTAKGKAEFVTQMVVDALAPTNLLFTNPAALKRAFETGGQSVAKGMANFVYDLLHNGGRPRQVDRSAFTVGEDLAATPGKVVFKNELMELIQYAPQTDEVFEIPLLLSPPWINKYYIMDLAPGRSFVEWAVQHGHTTFAISYRNADEDMANVSLDDYLIHGPRKALDVIADITGSDVCNIVGLCIGGTLTAILLAYLAAAGERRVNAATLLNTLLDFSDPGPLGCFTDRETVSRIEGQMRRKGYLEGSSMRTTFDLLRSNDLIWNYVTSNWLMGEDPPKFDILAWNSDSTNLPAAMHSFYLRSCYIENQLAQGEMEIAGSQLDLSKIQADVFIVGAENDHIAPWRSSYTSTQLLSNADVRFVLTSAGHIAGIVNPPGGKRKYWTQAESPPHADIWREGASEVSESWWKLWAEWIAERAGSRREPPPMGSEDYPALQDAPGSYVHE